jgi:hypothetical protein
MGIVLAFAPRSPTGAEPADHRAPATGAAVLPFVGVRYDTAAPVEASVPPPATGTVGPYGSRAPRGS